MNQYKFGKKELDEFIELNHNLMHFTAEFLSIVKRRELAVKKLFQEVSQKTNGSPFSEDVLFELQWCVHQERHIRAVYLPDFERTRFHMNNLFNLAQDYWNDQNNMSKFKKLFSPKKVYSAKKLLAQTTVLKKIFRTFDDNLDHIESRLATEEKFIKHNASGLLDSLRVFWKKDEELFHEMASNVKELYAFVNSEYAWLGIKIVGGSFLGVLGFYFASQPAEPAQFNDLSPGGYFLVGIYLSSVALYNLAKACAVIDKEEIAEFFMLKNTIIKSERK